MSFTCQKDRTRMYCTDSRTRTIDGKLVVVRVYKCRCCGLDIQTHEHPIDVVPADGSVPSRRERFDFSRRKFEALLDGRWTPVSYRTIGLNKAQRELLADGSPRNFSGVFVRLRKEQP